MPDHAVARNNLGTILAKTCRLHQAEATFRQAMLADPYCEDAHNNLKNVLREIQRLSRIEIACERDIEMNVDNEKSRHRLGRRLWRSGDWMKQPRVSTMHCC